MNDATEGLRIALYALTALGNAAAVANTTVTYTNSAGTPGRTGTIGPIATTSQVGTFYPMALQAGGRGVQSVQAITSVTASPP